MRKFNLYSRPHTFVCVDDDSNFLELLKLALSENFKIRFYTQTQPAIDYINNSAKLIKEDLTIFREIFDTTNETKSAVLRTLLYWNKGFDRWNFPEIVILDYAMPKITGLELLTFLDDWLGCNILLTGAADESIAVDAFNSSIIHRYIPKQSQEVIESLLLNINALQPKLFYSYQKLCESVLSLEQIKILSNPYVENFLIKFVKNNWTEYIVLHKPFGLLGIASDKKTSFLQIESKSDLSDMVSIAKLDNWDIDTLQSIESGQLLANSLLRQALNNQIEPSLSPILNIENTNIVSAHFEFDLTI